MNKQYTIEEQIDMAFAKIQRAAVGHKKNLQDVIDYDLDQQVVSFIHGHKERVKIMKESWVNQNSDRKHQTNKDENLDPGTKKKKMLER